MKELSVEEKAKAYDDVRKKIAIRFGSNVADEIFSQFEMSEDERIKEFIISGMAALKKQGKKTFATIPINDCIAWLEKQKGIKEYGYNAILEVNGIVRDINFIDFDTTGTSMQIPLENHTLKSGDKVKVTINKFEKQGEQKSTIEMKSVEESLGIDSDTYNNIVDECIYGEQKPAWSEEDEKMLNDIIMCGEHHCYLDAGNIAWLKSLKDRVQPQQEWKQENTDDLTDFENAMMHIGGSFFGENAGLDPNDTNVIREQANLLLELVPQQEWSEKDREILESCISLMSYNDAAKEETDWLKHLRLQLKQPLDEDTQQWIDSIIKDYENKLATDMEHCATINAKINILKFLRPQNRWKPSEEQMKVLEELVEDNNQRHFYTILKSLYEQLKKL